MNPRDNTLPDLVFTTDDSERCKRSIKSKGFATVESFDDWEPLAVRTWFLSEGGIDWVRVALLVEDIRDGGTEDERNSSERKSDSDCRGIAEGDHCRVGNVREGVLRRLNRLQRFRGSRARYYWLECHKKGLISAGMLGRPSPKYNSMINKRTLAAVAGHVTEVISHSSLSEIRPKLLVTGPSRIVAI